MTLLIDLSIISSLKVSQLWKNIHKSGEMQTWYIDFKCFAVNLQNVGLRERNIKLLLETFTYVAITETVTCAIKIETVMWIMHCRKCHLHNYNRDSYLRSYNGIFTHIFASETVTCISAAETFNCIITTETVTCIIIIEAQNLHNCSRRCHLHNCYRKCQLPSSNRTCHLQNWLQKLSLEELITVRDSCCYNKEIKGMSKPRFKTK